MTTRGALESNGAWPFFTGIAIDVVSVAMILAARDIWHFGVVPDDTELRTIAHVRSEWVSLRDAAEVGMYYSLSPAERRNNLASVNVWCVEIWTTSGERIRLRSW